MRVYRIICREENLKKPIIPIMIILLLLSSSFIGLSFKTEKAEDPQQTMDGGLMDSAWPMKCHDLHHTSQSPYSTADNPGAVIWKFRSEWDGSMESSAIIGNNGTIYFGTMGTDCQLYALSPNGTKQWSYPVGLMIWSTPAIAEDGTIYVTSYDNYLHALFPNGTRKWRFDADDSISSSPAIDDDGTIYFGCSNKKIFAVNPNGTEKWHYTTGHIIVSDPAIGDDGTIYIGSGDTYLYALYPNGSMRWRFKTEDWVKSHPSIAEDGTIYFDSFDGYLYALYPNSTMKWRIGGGTGCGSAAIDVDGTIYIGGNNLRAIYPNGTVKWSLDLGGSTGHTSPTISADGAIYVSAGKHLVAVNPNGTEKWRKKIAGVHAQSSPIIGKDGTIYVGSTWENEQNGFWYSYLYAFGRGELIADANGPYYGDIDKEIQFTGTVFGGIPPYTYHWDFGDGNESEEQNPRHTYTNIGNYTVTFTVTDSAENVSTDITWAVIEILNDPPEKPDIDGPISGTAGAVYEYTFVSIDPEDDDVRYYIDWDDGYIEEWIGPYPSGEEVTVSHTFEEQGIYTISAKAKDIHDAESGWGYLEVEMPFSYTSLFQRFLERFPRAFPILRLFLQMS